MGLVCLPVSVLDVAAGEIVRAEPFLETSAEMGKELPAEAILELTEPGTCNPAELAIPESELALVLLVSSTVGLVVAPVSSVILERAREKTLCCSEKSSSPESSVGTRVSDTQDSPHMLIMIKPKGAITLTVALTSA